MIIDMVLMDADDISRCAQESIDIIIMKNNYRLRCGSPWIAHQAC